MNASASATAKLCSSAWKKASTDATPSLAQVFHLVDGFRIALRVIFTARRHSAQRNQQILQLALSQLKRFVALQLCEAVAADAAYIRTYLCTTDGTSPEDEIRSQPPLSPRLLLLPCNADVPLSLAIEFQSVILSTSHFPQASLADVSLFLDVIGDQASGIAAWASAADKSSDGMLRKASHRMRLLVERCLSKLAQGLVDQREAGEHTQKAALSETILRVRREAILWLLAVDDEQNETRRPHVTARIERMLVSHYREAATSGEKAWLQINTAMQEIEASMLVLEHSAIIYPDSEEWAKVKEIWRRIAVKNGDKATASRLASSVVMASQEDPDPSVAVRNALSICSDAVLIIDSVRAKAEKDVTASVDVHTPAAEALRKLAGLSLQSVPLGDRQKLLLCIDRLRRRCCNQIDRWLKLANRKDYQQLFEAVLQAETSLRVVTGHSGEAQAIGAALAGLCGGYRALGLALYDVNQQNESFDWLQRGIAVVDQFSVENDAAGHRTAVLEQYSQFAAALYYAGGRVYTAREYAPAARFLLAAAESSEKAMCQQPSEEDANLLAKKWTYVAACYQQLSRPSDALHAFKKSISAMPSTRWGRLDTSASSHTPREIFESDDDTEWVPLARTLRSLFETSVFDLLADQQSPDTSVWGALDVPTISPEAKATCLEHLATATWLEDKMHADGAAGAAGKLLDKALQCIDASQYPIRRARVLLCSLERSMLRGEADDSCDAICAEIVKLLSIDDLRKDAAFHPHAPALLSSSYLLRILLLDRDDVEAVSKAAQTAVASLCTLIKPAPSPVSARTASSRTRTGAAAPLRTVTQSKQATVAGNKAVKPRSKAAAKTVIKPTVKQEAESTPGKLCSPTVLAATRVTSLLAVTCDFLAACGHTLLSAQLLKLLRKLTVEGDKVWIEATADLARQLWSLGKQSKAESLIEAALVQCEGRGFVEVQTMTLFLRAQIRPSQAHYQTALDAALRLQESPTRGSGIERALDKAANYRRVSAGAEAYSAVALSQDDLSQAIEGAMCATTNAMRAASLLSKITSPGNEDTDAEGLVSAAKSKGTVARGPHELSSLKVARAHWQTLQAVVNSLHRLARLYQLRGSARDAESFASEAVDYCSGLTLGLGRSQSLLLRAEIRLQLHRRSDAEEDIAKALQARSSVWLPEAAMLACIRGDQLARDPQHHEEAIEAYATGYKTLKALEQAYTEVEASPRSGSRISLGEVSLLPELHCRLLRRQAWLLQILGKHSESRRLIEQADANEAADVGSQASTERHLIQGRFALHTSLRAMQGDAIWGMVPEAAIALPLAHRAKGSSIKSDHIVTAIAAALGEAEAAFAQILAAPAQCSALSLRYAMAEVSLITAYRPLFRAEEEDCAKAIQQAAQTLDQAAAVTLHRELLHAVDCKLESGGRDKGIWLRLPEHHKLQSSAKHLTLRKTATPILAKGKIAQRGQRCESPVTEDSDDDEDEDEDASRAIAALDLNGPLDEEAVLRKFWTHQQQRLRSGQPAGPDLPDGWTVISIGLSADRNSLLLARRSGCPSLSEVVFSLPIDRQSRREGEEQEDMLTVPYALEELSDIVTSSNDLTSSARSVSSSQDVEERKEWWTRRRELDERMKSLCEQVESKWLGAFKSIFMDPLPVERDSPVLKTFKRAFDAIVQRMCFPAGIKKGSAIDLDDGVFHCIAGLVPSMTSDEDLEDLLHFIMDAYQFNGEPIAVDEADLDLLAMDMRSALEEFRSSCARTTAAPAIHPLHHIFLVLDKDTAPIPWESIPALRRRPVCRIPSMTFLQDRIEMARRLGATRGSDGAFHLPQDCKAFYLLNPSQDLAKSQQRFEGYLKSKTRWRGIVGRAPAANDFVDALETQPLVLYFGHSGAEQFARASRLRALPKCAVTMLWGCSSALLRDQGDFDRTGTPHNYMLAGAPAMVGQLFDATDKELDSISESVLIKLGLKEEASEELKAALKTTKGRSVTAPTTISTPDTSISLAQAVAESRDSCRLPYLSGAAPVVWGVPVYFDL